MKSKITKRQGSPQNSEKLTGLSLIWQRSYPAGGNIYPSRHGKQRSPCSNAVGDHRQGRVQVHVQADFAR